MRPSVPLLSGLLLTAPLSAAFAEEAADVLAKVDTVLNKFNDQQIRFRADNLTAGSKTPGVIEFQTRVKGGKTFTEFLAPGDLKGTRVLTMTPTQIYIWLPDFGKIRRVASHSLNQGFMGTTLTQQDMATFAYSALYVPSLTTSDDSTWTLELTTKEAKDTAYDKLVMVVDKAKGVPLRIDYYNDAGTDVVRREERSGYQCNAVGYCLFGQMKMTDLTSGAWTTLTPVEAKIDAGVPDDVFSTRTLQLGL